MLPFTGSKTGKSTSTEGRSHVVICLYPVSSNNPAVALVEEYSACPGSPVASASLPSSPGWILCNVFDSQAQVPSCKHFHPTHKMHMEDASSPLVPLFSMACKAGITWPMSLVPVQVRYSSLKPCCLNFWNRLLGFLPESESDFRNKLCLSVCLSVFLAIGSRANFRLETRPDDSSLAAGSDCRRRCRSADRGDIETAANLRG
jgi:hypothetical protein